MTTTISDDIMEVNEVNSMQYMNKQLLAQYELYHKQYADIPEISKPLMNVSDVLRAYFILADYFSDSTAEHAETMLCGIRDMNLMISALGRQVVQFSGNMKYQQPLEICATLFYGLVKNHAFADGNKRTALLTLLYQLDCYGFMPVAPQREFEMLVVAVAANNVQNKYAKVWKRIPKQHLNDNADSIVWVITNLLRKMTARKDHTFHIDVPAREFIAAMQQVGGCTCHIEGDRIKVQRRIVKTRWFGKSTEEVRTCMIPFRGDTRPITAKTTREALDKLDLYDQFPSYQSFVAGTDPRYMLINKFEGPLRRLKDK